MVSRGFFRVTSRTAARGLAAMLEVAGEGRGGQTESGARGLRGRPSIRAWSMSVREAWVQTVQRLSVGFRFPVSGFQSKHRGKVIREGAKGPA